ncbi:MAG: hypothetical protein J7J78_04440 [Thermoprotei archaeon]|nr:hypothetical protein [Thermoprotei archaeon]
MSLSLGEKIFYIIIILAIILSNPPILNIVNEYCKTHPLTLGFPTFWLYLEIVWTIVIVAFAIAAIKIEKWRNIEEKIEKILSGKEVQ